MHDRTNILPIAIQIIGYNAWQPSQRWASPCETNEPKTWHSQIWILTKTIKVHIVCMHLTLLKDFFHRFLPDFLKIFRFHQFWGMDTILPITPTFWDLAVSNFAWQSFIKCFQRFSKINWRFFFIASLWMIWGFSLKLLSRLLPISDFFVLQDIRQVYMNWCAHKIWGRSWLSGPRNSQK